MKAITKYVATDGTEFFGSALCELYEDQCSRAKELTDRLAEHPEKGSVQQDPVLLDEVWNGLLSIARELSTHEWLEKGRHEIHASYPGRIIDEVFHKGLQRAWYRMHCVDQVNREHSQPYYAYEINKQMRAETLN